MPVKRIIRLKELTHLVGMAESQLRQAVAIGAFPKPIKLSDTGRSIGWLEAEVIEWQQKRAELHRVAMNPVVRKKAGTKSAKAG